MDIKTHFSFLRLFNTIKGVAKPAKPGEFDTEWLNDPKVKKTKALEKVLKKLEYKF